MSRNIIRALLLATAACGAGAYAQSYDPGGYGNPPAPQQQYDSSAPQDYNSQGDPQSQQAAPPASYQDQNGQYVDHSSSETPSNQPNNYARDIKDGPLGTSPGS
ncbi:hypothetical protein [Herbaspirillum sp.]|uniref:hypothetical protein n=1 Tax=Herbaspirillum sp. TaxID=1890675 RepID=UPI001B06A658|nr:hypothetical protein [Herbaspirillum sp.]MBO9538011.1 hypothetical protein [Herbaspirillum sp.]